MLNCVDCSILGCTANGIDLSYPLNDKTIFWPGGEKFKLCMECSVNTEYGYDYAAGSFSCAEHGGTHVDAPFHFAKDGKTVDLLELDTLIAPCNVIDISGKCDKFGNENYCLSLDDVEEYERNYGEISSGSIVLVRTGWSKYWEQGPKAYLGYDESTDGPLSTSAQSLSFPGIGESAANLLANRNVSGVGIDTASLDPGCSDEFIAHRILLGAGIYGIENINQNIDLLPPNGSSLMVMPMKISGGSGAPARVVGLVKSNV